MPFDLIKKELDEYIINDEYQKAIVKLTEFGQSPSHSANFLAQNILFNLYIDIFFSICASNDLTSLKLLLEHTVEHVFYRKGFYNLWDLGFLKNVNFNIFGEKIRDGITKIHNEYDIFKAFTPLRNALMMKELEKFDQSKTEAQTSEAGQDHKRKELAKNESEAEERSRKVMKFQ